MVLPLVQTADVQRFEQFEVAIVRKDCINAVLRSCAVDYVIKRVPVGDVDFGRPVAGHGLQPQPERLPGFSRRRQPGTERVLDESGKRDSVPCGPTLGLAQDLIVQIECGLQLQVRHRVCVRT